MHYIWCSILLSYCLFIWGTRYRRNVIWLLSPHVRWMADASSCNDFAKALQKPTESRIEHATQCECSRQFGISLSAVRSVVPATLKWNWKFIIIASNWPCARRNQTAKLFFNFYFRAGGAVVHTIVDCRTEIITISLHIFAASEYFLIFIVSKSFLVFGAFDWSSGNASSETIHRDRCDDENVLLIIWQRRRTRSESKLFAKLISITRFSIL